MEQIMKTAVKNNRRGAVLALVMIVVLLLSMTSVVVLGMARSARIRAVNSVADLSARCAADAGIEHTLYMMNKSLATGTWDVANLPAFNSEPLANSNANYTVSMSGSPAAGYQIISTGLAGQRTRTVRVTAQLTGPLPDFVVFTKNKLDMKNKVVVDAYNSSDPSDPDNFASIGTESTEKDSIIFKNETVVNGDVYLSPGSDPDEVISGQDAIKGEIFTMPRPFVWPTIMAPAFVGSKGNIKTDDKTLTASDSGSYTSIEISNDGKLTANGDVVLYVTGNVELKNGASIEVNPNASFELYVDGNVDTKNSSGVNNKNKIPSSFKLVGTGTDQKFDLKNDTDFYGVIWAPNADMVIHNSAEIYGSITADTLEIKNSGNIHYDKALNKADVDDPGVRFIVTRWEEL